MSESTKKTYEDRAKSEPTELHKAFAQWLYIQTGVRPDLKTVQLACAFRMDFQRSEENQSDLQARKAAALAKKQKAAADKRARLEAQLAKLQAELAETPAAPVAKKATPKKAATPTPAEPAPAPAAPAQPVKRAARTRRTTASPKTFDSVPETDK